jgi:RHS repeat-associated protein
VAAVKSDGTEELSALYPGRNAFGALEGASAGGGTNTESGYTGASTPNQTGGFTYLRNRWYDPATGRFLTQDPIGLAGGVNLYAYAGNDPVAYSDPFGLCPKCPDEVASVRVGPIAGLRYKAKLGVVKGEVFVGASASGGVKQEISAGGATDNSLTGGAKLGVDLEITAWGEGPQLHLGPRAGADANGDRLTATPVQGDGTISVAGTIPLVWAGPVPVGGVQVEGNLNIPAAYRRIRDSIKNFLGGD